MTPEEIGETKKLIELAEAVGKQSEANLDRAARYIKIAAIFIIASILNLITSTFLYWRTHNGHSQRNISDHRQPASQNR